MNKSPVKAATRMDEMKLFKRREQHRSRQEINCLLRYFLFSYRHRVAWLLLVRQRFSTGGRSGGLFPQPVRNVGRARLDRGRGFAARLRRRVAGKRLHVEVLLAGVVRRIRVVGAVRFLGVHIVLFGLVDRSEPAYTVVQRLGTLPRQRQHQGRGRLFAESAPVLWRRFPRLPGVESQCAVQLHRPQPGAGTLRSAPFVLSAADSRRQRYAAVAEHRLRLRSPGKADHRPAGQYTQRGMSAAVAEVVRKSRSDVRCDDRRGDLASLLVCDAFEFARPTDRPPTLPARQAGSTRAQTRPQVEAPIP
ncbi:conserved hypothetical protein [Trichinella spiralis]|uniref:hypothetical protein n=1 Tax=Trichinella spiralis TaxID=6334 RepID=UPI0001EFB766|nr:conserved hypothetical protein [Trichinella spiralis]